MKRVIGSLIALLLVAGGMLISSVPAGAAGGACGWWPDNPGTVYGPRNYSPTSQSVYDVNQGQYVTVNTDVSDYQYTDPYNGKCYVAYRVSEWGPYADAGYSTTVRVWICGHQEQNYTLARAPGTGQQILSNNWDGYSATGGGAQYMWVPQVGANAMFYDTSGCGFQSDNLYTYASASGWSAQPTSTYQGIFYVRI